MIPPRPDVASRHTTRQEPVAARGCGARPDRSGLCPRGCGATSESTAFAAPTAGAHWRGGRRGSRFPRRAQSVRDCPGERGDALAHRRGDRGRIRHGSNPSGVTVPHPPDRYFSPLSCSVASRHTARHLSALLDPRGARRPTDRPKRACPRGHGATGESTAFAAPTAGARLRAEAVRGEDFPVARHPSVSAPASAESRSPPAGAIADGFATGQIRLASASRPASGRASSPLSCSVPEG